MWTDWLKFQAQAARQRREAAEAIKREKIRRAARLAELTEYIAIGMAVIVLAGLMVGGFIIYMKHLR
jgi:hypothetical protein